MTTKAEPTPGEWTADGHGHIHAGDKIIGDAFEWPEWRANAALFAASKDLLEACEALLSHVRLIGGPTDSDWSGRWSVPSAVAAGAQSAIAKARGES